MSIAIRLPAEVEERLSSLAKKTKRSKSFYVREAIECYLEDIEDYYRAMETLKNPGQIYTLDEVRRMCDLED